jgi:NAD(P)-dependent dehydrogenase (short-subunit alcohol dehydrogenase family)
MLTARTEHPSKGVIGSLEETRSLIHSLGGEAMTMAADLTREADLERLHREALATWGHVDILVNNAAAMPYYSPLSEATVAQLDEEYKVLTCERRFGSRSCSRATWQNTAVAS